MFLVRAIHGEPLIPLPDYVSVHPFQTIGQYAHIMTDLGLLLFLLRATLQREGSIAVTVIIYTMDCTLTEYLGQDFRSFPQT
jgi:hypothetical protein